MVHSKHNWAGRVLLTAAAMMALQGKSIAQDKAADGESMSALIAEIEKEQAKLPRTRVSVAAVLAEVGHDASPAALHGWVRANVRAVDYAGSLRDVDGTLADRTGNSLDRSLLLARLLTQNGFETKIVGVDQPSPAADAPQAKPVAGPDADEAKSKNIADTLVALAAPTKPAGKATPRHWWVRYNDGTNWVDLDPALEKPGQSLGAPVGKELPADSRTQQIAVPPELQYRVTLVLQVERWEKGKLLESPALQLALDDTKQAGLVASRMTFQPYTAAISKVTTRDDATSPKLKAALLSEKAWCPVIIDGTSAGRLAKTFDEAGIVGDVPRAMGRGEDVGRAVGGAFGGLGGGMGGGTGDASDKPTVLTAVFADYLINSPDGTTKTIRRPVFDTLGPAQRQAAAAADIAKPKWTDEQKLARGVELNAIHSTLVARAAVDFDGYVGRYGQRVIDAKPLIEESAKGKLDDVKASRLADLTSFNSLELFASMRSTASDPSLYVAEPQIYRRIVTLAPDSGDELKLRATSDLAWNPLKSTGDAASIVRAGVLDTLREAAVVMAHQESPEGSTPALFDAATKGGATPKLLKAPAELSGIELPADSVARIKADLTAGQWVIVPDKAVTVNGTPRIGWWRIDPTTLQTVGAMDNGYLATTIEYTETHEVNGIQITKFGRMRVGDAAEKWAQEVIKRRGNTSWNQWTNLLKMAQKAIDATGKLPPL